MTWKHSSPEEDTAKIKEYRETRAPFVVMLNPVWSEEMWTATPFVTLIKSNTAATIMNLWVSSKGQLLLPCKFQLSVLLLCFDQRLLFIAVGSRGSDCPLWISDTFNIVQRVSVSVFLIIKPDHSSGSSDIRIRIRRQTQLRSLLWSFPVEPYWIGTSGCSPFISVLLQLQKSKIDADNRVQYPPIAPFSAQLRKHQCPSGNPIIVGIV